VDALRATELLDAQRIAARRDEAGLLVALREALREANARLDEDFRSGRSAGDLVRERAAVVDALLRCAWEAQNLPDQGMALVAVGGYGRGELHPASDIDLLILLDREPEELQQALEAFLTLLWDMGLQIGHSVRSVDECAAQAEADVTVMTNLIEARLLLGDGAPRCRRSAHLTGADVVFGGLFPRQAGGTEGPPRQVRGHGVQP
jgi:UTP:GlnB (protein PII) uridylyltransferase